MTTMERLIAEIFERKNRIERQLLQQFETYGESLALNIIADGGRPPPSLWETGRGSSCYTDPGGLNKDQLISGLCFPVPLVSASLADPDPSFTISEMMDGDVCKPIGLFREVSKEVTTKNKQNHNRTIEAKFVEDFPEPDELNRVSYSRSNQRDFKSKLSKKAKSTNVEVEDGTNNKKICRRTRSSAATWKVACVEDSFVANNCANVDNGCGGRITRSRSRLLAKVLSDKSSGDKHYDQLKDIETQPKCQSDIKQLNFVDINNYSSDSTRNVDIPQMYAVGIAANGSISNKMQFLKSSTPSDSISLVGHEKVNVFHGCNANEDTLVDFSKENQFHSSENASCRLQASQLEPENPTSSQTMDMHGSSNQHVQEGDMLHDAEDVRGMEANILHGAIEEGKDAFPVVEDLEFVPQVALSCELPGLPSISPTFSPTRSAILKFAEGILGNQVNTVVSKETSSGNLHSHSRGKQLCGQLKNASENDATLWQGENDPLLGGTDLQFQKLKGSASIMKPVTGLDIISKCGCPYVFSGNADHFHSPIEGYLCNEHASLLDLQPLEGDNLAAVASLIGKEVDGVPVECQRDDHHISENKDCSVCYCQGSCNHISMLKVSGNYMSKLHLKCQTERKCYDNYLEGKKKRHRHSVHGCQSFSTSSFPVQEVLQKVQSETLTTEVVRTKLNFSAMAADPTYTNDVSTPDEHSVETFDDDSMLLTANKVALGPDAVEKFIIEKALASGGGESYSLLSVPGYCLTSSTVHNKNRNSYMSVGVCINESKQPIEVSDCKYANSWPKRKNMKYRSRNVTATSPRSRARSILDINEQNECKYNTVLQSPPRLEKNQISDVAPVAGQNNVLHEFEDDSDYNPNIHDLLIAPDGDIQINALHAFEESLSVCSRDEEIRPINLMPSEAESQQTPLVTEFFFPDANAIESNFSDRLGHHDKSKEPNDAQLCLHGCGITSISDTADVKSNYDETMPEFEGFKIDPPYRLEDDIVYEDVDIPSIAKERAFVIEQLRLSSTFSSPRSKHSLMNQTDTVLGVLHTSPLGILENMELKFSLEHNNYPGMNYFATNSSIELLDVPCNIGTQFDGTTLERSHSLSSSSALFGSEPKNPPLTPPIPKFSHRKFSGKRSSSSSSLIVNSIPELTCFRIDENSTTDENADFIQVGYFSYRTSSTNIELSSNSKPLSNVTALCQNNAGLLSNSKGFVVRDSLCSMQSGAASSLGFDLLGTESKVDNKENLGHIDAIQKPQKAARTISRMSERSRLSCKSSDSIGNYQNMRKGCKSSNIISSISSFVPQIQSKNKAALSLQVAGMKDIKVRALETAEAAKRMEDQKKMERDKRMAEAKLMREKVKQENARQLKLKQKQKEEQMRKKEEDVAARKRQREEEARKVKNTKRRCIEETRALEREHEDKLHNVKDQKDLRQKLLNEKLKKGKQTACKGQNKLEKGAVNRNQMDVQVQHPTIQAPDVSDENNIEEGVGCSNDFREANEGGISATQKCINLLSYDMSPYQNSEDADREDSWPKKHIPMWARRESLGKIILSNQRLDPKEIFSRKRSFNISRVLSTQVPLRRH